MPSSPLRVALVQCSSVPGDVAANAIAAARTISMAAAQGAKLVVFPELSLTGYDLDLLASTPNTWLEDANDGRFEPVRRACVASGTTAVLGAPFRGRAGDQLIAAPIVGPDGGTHLSFKEHIHGSEAAVFRPGEAAAPFEVSGWRVAVAICFDAAHPRHAEHAAQGGADVYAVSALYMRGEERRRDLHLAARAMDNRIFSVLSNYAGRTGAHVSCGMSGAWSPTGDVMEVVEGAGDAMLVVDLDPGQLPQLRG
ncbi:MAG: carbon-nitrogen hydrolase family protein [Polyangiaceae bacterium]